MTQIAKINKLLIGNFVKIIFITITFVYLCGCAENGEQKEAFTEAKRNFDLGMYNLAVYDFENYIKRYGNSSEAWKLLGISYAKLGDLDKAYSCFASGVKFKPSDPINYAYLGQILRIKGEYEQSVDLFKKSCDMGSGDACQMLITAIAENANRGYMSPGEILQYRRSRPRSPKDYYNR